MSRTPSTMLPLGTEIPDFNLKDFNNKTFSNKDLKKGQPTLVFFISNHCPYVKHVRSKFVEIIAEYQKKGLNAVAINSNDIKEYPDDSPENMKLDAEKYNYTFPYLFDETQETAKEFHAACTPDFFLFDKNNKLFYRGQMDNARPGNEEKVSGKDLLNAIELVLSDSKPPEIQKPSLGCNIKWKPGNAPDYFN